MTEQEWLVSMDPAAMLAFVCEHGYGRHSLDMTAAPLATDRKLRLFACACCRQVWPLLTDERSRRAVEVAERYADGEATVAELEDAQHNAFQVWSHSQESNPPGLARYAATNNIQHAAGTITRHGLINVPPPAAQAALLRCLFGNPFRPVRLPRTREQVLEARRHAVMGGCCDRFADQMACECLADAPGCVVWLTPAVTAIARGIYEDRTFEHLPILADALEEAGCPAEMRWQDEKGGPLPDFCGPNPLLSHLRERPRQWHQAGVLCTDPSPLHARGCWALDLLLGKE